MTASPKVLPHGPKGPVFGVGAVLVSIDEAAFSPMRRSLDHRTPFAARIVAAYGSPPKAVPETFLVTSGAAGLAFSSVSDS